MLGRSEGRPGAPRAAWRDDGEERASRAASRGRGVACGGEKEMRGLVGRRGGWDICRRKKKREVASVREGAGSFEEP